MNHAAMLERCFLFDPGDAAARAMRRNLRTGMLAFFLTYALLHWMSAAHAGGEGLFGSIVADTEGQTQGWLSGLASAGKATFLVLASLEITWCAILWAFEKDSMTGLMGDMVKSIMTIGFFYTVLLNAPEWIPAIHAQFTAVSKDTLEVTSVTPDGIIGEGIRVAAFVWINLVNPVNIFAGLATQFVVLITAVVGMIGTIGVSTVTSGGADLVEPLTQIGMILLWGFGSWAIAGLVALVVLICYAIVAIQLVLLQVEMFLLMAAGAVLLGLGGSRWTRDYVQKYFNHALVTGIRFLVLMMVMQLTMAGLGSTPWEATASMFQGMASSFQGGDNGDSNGAMVLAMSGVGVMVVVLLKTWIALKAPDLAGALFSGGSALTASGLADTTMAIVGAPSAVVQSGEAVAKVASGEFAKTMSSAMGSMANKGGGGSGARPSAASVGGL